MIRVTQIAPGIYHVEHGGGHSSRCAVYLLAAQRGLIFETGPSSQVSGILEALERIGYPKERIAYIVPSHLHADHAGGAGSLAQQLPQARVVAHEQGARHLIAPFRLIAGTREAFGDDFEDEFGPIVPVPEAQLMTIKGGERLGLGDRQVELLYTPGHTLNSICLFDPASRGLFVGDCLGTLAGSRVVMPQAMPTQFDLEATLETIARLEALQPRLLCPSHFGPVKDIPLAFRSAREVVATWKDVALTALRAGEPKEAIVDRFQALVDSYMTTETAAAPYRPAPFRVMLGLCVTGYTLYFKRKGLL